MNLNKELALAEAIFGTPSEPSNVTRITATAVTDSAGGSATVELEDGTQATIDVTGMVKSGDTIIVNLQDGHPIGEGAVGWGDRLYEDASGGQTLIRESAAGILVAKVGDTYGALVSSTGAFQVLSLTWDGDNPIEGTVITNLDEDSADLASGLATLEGTEWSGGYMLHGQAGGVITSTKDKLVGGDNGIVFMDERPDPVWDDTEQAWVIPTGADDAVTYLKINARSIEMSGFRFAPLSAHDTEWTYLTGSATATNFCRWRCRSGIVFVELNYDSSAGISKTSKLFGTIPSSWRPSRVVTAACQLSVSNNNISSMWVTATGEVRASAAATSTTIYGSLSYPISQSIIVPQ